MTGNIQKLIKGYKEFRAGTFKADKEIYTALEKTQSPAFMVISCCDSRVNPNAIFSLSPGELYGIRNVANLVPSFENAPASISSALEHGINFLGIPNIIVLGHANCGGIAAALNLEETKEKAAYIGEWVGQIADVRDEVISENNGDNQLALEQASIANSIRNLRTYPWIAKAEDDNRLNLIGAYFDIGSATLAFLDEKSGTFSDAAS